MGQRGDRSLPPSQAVTCSWDIHKPDHLCFLAVEGIQMLGASHSRPVPAARFSTARHSRQAHAHFPATLLSLFPNSREMSGTLKLCYIWAFPHVKSAGIHFPRLPCEAGCPSSRMGSSPPGVLRVTCRHPWVLCSVH